MYLVALVLAGCGGGSAAGPTVTTTASTKPVKGCLAIEDRKKLAKNPPKVGMSFVSTDLDNFTGDTPAQCNRRSLVYWGPDTPLADADRPTVIVTLTFAADAADANLQAGSAEADEVMRVNGEDVHIFQRDGQALGRFAAGPAVVDVFVACLRPENPQKTVACRRPPQSAEFLRTRVRDIVDRLRPQLRAAL
jgi:hypothetical protein